MPTHAFLVMLVSDRGNVRLASIHFLPLYRGAIAKIDLLHRQNLLQSNRRERRRKLKYLWWINAFKWAVKSQVVSQSLTLLIVGNGSADRTGVGGNEVDSLHSFFKRNVWRWCRSQLVLSSFSLSVSWYLRNLIEVDSLSSMLKTPRPTRRSNQIMEKKKHSTFSKSRFMPPQVRLPGRTGRASVTPSSSDKEILSNIDIPYPPALVLNPPVHTDIPRPNSLNNNRLRYQLLHWIELWLMNSWQSGLDRSFFFVLID